jgi:hypothetical protein
MKKNSSWKKIISSIVLVSMIFVLTTKGMQPMQVQATTKGADALKAYNKLLSKDTFNWDNGNVGAIKNEIPSKNITFTTVDIDKDGIKELLLYTGSANNHEYAKIYTYTGGKVKCIYTGDRMDVYSKNGLMSRESSGTGSFFLEYYKYSEGKLTQLTYKEGTDTAEYIPETSEVIRAKNDSVYYFVFKVKDKSVSYSAYSKYVNKLKKNNKKLTLKYSNNTSSIRKKYL